MWSSARSGSRHSTRRSTPLACSNRAMATIYVLNGPNLNSLGTREPEKYGHSTLADVEKLCRETAARHGLEVEFRQSNHEGVIVDTFHEAKQKGAVGIVIN